MNPELQDPAWRDSNATKAPRHSGGGPTAASARGSHSQEDELMRPLRKPTSVCYPTPFGFQTGTKPFNGGSVDGPLRPVMRTA